MSQTTTQKQRFFALYLGCEVQTNYRLQSIQGKAMIKAKGRLMEVDLGMDGFGILLETEKDKTNYVYLNDINLIVRHISSLTDEELIEMISLREPTSCNIKIKKNKEVIEFDFIYDGEIYSAELNCIYDRFCADYLRSIGILLPFDGLTTEQIIAQGWAEYKV